MSALEVVGAAEEEIAKPAVAAVLARRPVVARSILRVRLAAAVKMGRLAVSLYETARFGMRAKSYLVSDDHDQSRGHDRVWVGG